MDSHALEMTSTIKRLECEPATSTDAVSRTQVSHASYYQMAADSFTHILPESKVVDIEDIQREGFALYLAVAYALLYAIVLLYLIITLTIAGVNKEFLALHIPDVDQAVCRVIPVPITNTYLADTNGTWSSQKDFKKDWPLYEIVFTGSLVTPDQYTAAMRRIAAVLEAYGKGTSTWDHITSLIAWNLWWATDTQTQISLRPSAQLSAAFLGMAGTSVVSSAGGVCPSSKAVYDSTSMTLSFLPPKAATTLCDGIYNKTDSEYDMRTVVVAYALNYGVIDLSYLVPTNENSQVGDYRGSYYVFDNFPGMNPVFCIDEGANSSACFYASETQHYFAYPILTTSTDMQSESRACQCPGDAFDAFCNIGQHLTLIMVSSSLSSRGDDDGTGSNIVSPSATFALGLKLQRTANEGTGAVREQLALLGYNSLHAASSKSKMAKNATTAMKDLGADLLTFSLNIASGNAINAQGVWIENFGTPPMILDPESTTNDDRFQDDRAGSMIPRSACTVTIYRPAALSAMSLQAPVSVIQPYLACHATLRSAFINALGVASGSSSLLASVFLAGALYLLAQYINTGRRSQKILSPAKKRALEKAALQQELVLDKVALVQLGERAAYLEEVVGILLKKEGLPADFPCRFEPVDRGRPSEFQVNPMVSSRISLIFTNESNTEELSRSSRSSQQNQTSILNDIPSHLEAPPP